MYVIGLCGEADQQSLSYLPLLSLLHAVRRPSRKTGDQAPPKSRRITTLILHQRKGQGARGGQTKHKNRAAACNK